MRLKPSIVVLLSSILFLLSCSNEDPGTTPEEEELEMMRFDVPFDITVLANLDGDDFQVDINQGALVSDTEPVNITNNLGFPDQVRRSVRGPLVSYMVSFQDTPVWQRNTSTGEEVVQTNFFSSAIDPLFTTIRVLNSQNTLLTFFQNLEDTEEQYLNIYNVATGLSSDLLLGTGDDFSSLVLNSFIQDELLSLFFVDADDTLSLVIVDLVTGALVDRFAAANVRSQTLNGRDLVFILADGGYVFYNVDTRAFTPVVEEPFLLPPNGSFSSRFQGNRMFFTTTVQQPNVVNFGPAIFDFDTNTLQEFNVFNLFQRFITEIRPGIDSVSFSDWDIDFESETLITTYNFFLPNGTRAGGVLFLDFDLEVRQNVELGTLIPNTIIRQ